ncbi:hypothetical protein B0H16DRAFT_1656161 [Mycena metata]|uniref:Uncharacterized protein n=1 Tax=Mycena metata TaxID=1033252 RepID=A0AAD7DER4_9AGAR|nr:hypothetical protein B0H16DRAFT_1656161 [Mycena metata]
MPRASRSTPHRAFVCAIPTRLYDGHLPLCVEALARSVTPALLLSSLARLRRLCSMSRLGRRARFGWSYAASCLLLSRAHTRCYDVHFTARSRVFRTGPAGGGRSLLALLGVTVVVWLPSRVFSPAPIARPHSVVQCVLGVFGSRVVCLFFSSCGRGLGRFWDGALLRRIPHVIPPSLPLHALVLCGFSNLFGASPLRSYSIVRRAALRLSCSSCRGAVL